MRTLTTQGPEGLATGVMDRSGGGGPPGPEAADSAGEGGPRSRLGLGPPASNGAAWDMAAEIALVAVTASAVFGLGRLFNGGDFLLPLLLVAMASHGLAIATRRLGLGPAAAAAVSGLGLLLTLAWVVEPHTTTYGLPLGATWQAVADDLREAWTRFAVVRAPTDATRQFILAAAVAVWLAGFTADTFAFRFRARFEALLPSFVVFVFGAILGADRHRLAASGLYVAAVLLFVVASGPWQRTAASWIGGRARDGDAALARQAGLTALAVLLAAVIAGPLLPGAMSPAVVAWQEATRNKSSSRFTPSPFVDFRSRLVDQSKAEVFSVRSNVASYWRLTSLDLFDGTQWKLQSSISPARSRLPSDIAAPPGVEVVTQEFRIAALYSPWLPAAYRPEGFEGPQGIRYNEESSSLLTASETSDGLQYTVVSALPRLTADELSRASSALPPAVRERNLELPAGFSPRVRSQALDVVIDSGGGMAGRSPANPYLAARALQDWFRSGLFTYDLDVALGQDERAIETFVLEARRGYCEQFAGAYAAMARSLGLPARVAVGFTPGSRGDDGVFRVQAADAHAWPEVFLSGAGWVAFEPTPGRGVPGGESYTGVPAPVPSSLPAPTPAPAAEVPPTAGAPPAPTEGTPAPADDQAGASDSTWGGRRGLMVAAVLLLGALYVVGVPLAGRAARARRRALAVTADDRVLLAWLETQEELALAGVPRRASETATEYATRAGASGHASPEALRLLAGDSSEAAFAPAGAPHEAATRAESAATAIRENLLGRTSLWRRAMWSLDPRPVIALLRAGWPALTRRSGPGRGASPTRRA